MKVPQVKTGGYLATWVTTRLAAMSVWFNRRVRGIFVVDEMALFEKLLPERFKNEFTGKVDVRFQDDRLGVVLYVASREWIRDGKASPRPRIVLRIYAETDNQISLCRKHNSKPPLHKLMEKYTVPVQEVTELCLFKEIKGKDGKLSLQPYAVRR